MKVACILALGLVALDARVESTPDVEGVPAPPSSSRAAQARYLLAILRDDAESALVRAHVPVALGRLLQGTEQLHGALKAEVADALLEGIGRFTKDWKEVQQGCVLGLGLLADADDHPVDVRVREELARVSDATGDGLTRGLASIALGRIGSAAGNDRGRPGEAEVRALLLGRLSRGTHLRRSWAALGLAV